MLTQTDARRRITLPPATGIKPGDTVEIEVLEDGRILLIPVETIPRHQLWAWTTDSKQAIVSPWKTRALRRWSKQPRPPATWPRDGRMRIEIRPAFDEAVMSAEPPVRKAAAKMLVLLQSLEFVDRWKHPGLNFEKLHGMIEPGTGHQLYSLRVTASARAVTCRLNGPTLVLVSLHVQHDKAYRKR